ncbi:MAG: hypothetical protein L3J39_14635 [Verrucomicrobiales bacterium]|nr:hypothetical protein [Verrucomicrobiales bacterium]
MTDWELTDLPPIELIGATFAYEREHFPLKPFAVTISLAFIFSLAGLALATLREGSVAGLLGEQMSHREKVSIAGLIIALIFTAYFIDERNPKEPYQMHNASCVGSLAQGIVVSVAPPSAEGQILANKIHEDLTALSLYLQIEKLPPVFVIRRNDLDPETHEAGSLKNKEGIIMRTNFAHSEWDFNQFNESLIARVLGAYSNDRIRKEDRFWVLDGFTLFWSRRNEVPQSSPPKALDRSPDLLLRALYGTSERPPLTPSSMRRWFSQQDELGHEITAGIACSLLRVLESAVGEKKCQAFLRSILAVKNPSRASTSLRDLLAPPEKLFLQHTGMQLADFLSLWQQELQRLRPAYQEQLNTLPQISGELEFVKLSLNSSQANYSLVDSVDKSPNLKKRLYYATLPPFANYVPEHLLIPVPLDFTANSHSGILPDDFPRGTRLLFTFSLYSKALKCRIISGWQRKEAH